MSLPRRQRSAWRYTLRTLAILALPFSGFAASWTPLTNFAPGNAGVMLQLTDGSVMIQNSGSSIWLRLTPDIHGSYVNGTWDANPINPMSMNRLYFASQVLPDGRVWVLGGEYSGPFVDGNDDGSGEIWDPSTNTWSPIAPYPNNSQCGLKDVRSMANLTASSAVVTGIFSTARLQAGWVVAGEGIPDGTVITSVDSSSQIHISNPATSTGYFKLVFTGDAANCFGDDPTVLLSGTEILAGSINSRFTYIYSLATNTWSPGIPKVYDDQSDEEGWARLADGRILNYDLWHSINTNTGVAELYDPASQSWSGITPGDGTANGTLPLLSSPDLGFELGPSLRLQDDRLFVIGANNHTALYTPSTNTWAAGPDITGTLTNNQGTVAADFGADDAPAAILPNGHVLFAADAGPAQVTTLGNVTGGSQVITNIPSTAGLQPGWFLRDTVFSEVIPLNTYIQSVDSPTQVTITNSVNSTVSGLGIVFGGTFSFPTQLFDFDPTAASILPVSPAIPDNLNLPAFVTRLLMLPTGQALFSDGGSQLWVYTPDGQPNPALRPVVSNVHYNGGGVFTLTGKQLNGQSAGSTYGDDVQNDDNYPIVRLSSSNGSVYYCRTTNWNSTGVSTNGATAVDFTLNPGVTPGNYSLIVSGAGISSFPVFVSITQAEMNGR
jgi:hypothetical protein